MRAFIALELPVKIKKEINQTQIQLKRIGVQARWVKPEITHLTLAFLGSITPNKVQPVNRILEEVAHQIKPAHLKLYQVGCFPSPEKARVVFLDLQGELGKLTALSVKIRKRLKKENIWFDDKPLLSHITLGRIRQMKNLTRQIKSVKVKRIEFIASEVVFYQSTLTESGPIYRAIKTIYLNP